MARVGCARTLALALDKAVGTEQRVALVTADAHLIAELLAAHVVEDFHAGTGHQLGEDVPAVKYYRCAQDVKLAYL